MPKTARPAPSPRRRSLAALGFLGAVLLAAGLATVSPAQATWAGVEGPTCWLRDLLGSGFCPGCGLTRSTALAVQGNLAASWALHPAGAVTALLCCAGIAVHLDILRRGVRTAAHARFLRLGAALLTAAVLGGWLLTLFGPGDGLHG